MKKEFQKLFLLKRDFLYSLLAIAVPLFLQNAISFGVVLMDSVMLGSLGDIAVSAASLGSQPFSILISVTFGLSAGGSVLIAQYWGREDTGSIHKVMCISARFVCLAALGATVICLWMPESILRIFTDEQAIVEAGAGYLRLAALSYIPYSISNNYMVNMRAIERVKFSTLICLISFLVNIFFNYLFIFGKWGAPRLEVRGAAVGTVLARLSELMMALFYMYRREHTIGFRLHNFQKLDRGILRAYRAHSLPVLGNELLWSVGMFVTNIIVGRMGSTFITANSIAGVLTQFVYISLLGLGNASAIIIGKAIGERDRGYVQRAANTLLLFGLLAGLINCPLVCLIRPFFLSLYRITPAAYEAAYTIIGVLAALQPVQGVDVAGIVGVLRGGGDTRRALIYDCGSLWLVSIPMGIWTGWVLRLPIPLVYIAMKLDSPIKALSSLIRTRSKSWIHDVTAPDTCREGRTWGIFPLSGRQKEGKDRL